MLNGLSGLAPDLSSSAGTPVHVQIEKWLGGLITTGRVRAGDRLPKEKDLASELGVSRMTLRQALASLETRGMVERIPGRLGGTFVTVPKIDIDITGLAGFTEQLRRGQVRAGAKVVSAAVVESGRDVAGALGIARGAAAYEIVRVRSAHREPLALERSYLPVELFPDLLDHPLNGSLYALLRKRYDHWPQTAVEALEPFIAGPDEAGLLKVDEGSALMLIERTASSAAGVPVEYARDLFRPDRARITVRTTAPQ